jgi:hypothetical protein
VYYHDFPRGYRGLIVSPISLFLTRIPSTLSMVTIAFLTGARLPSLVGIERSSLKPYSLALDILWRFCRCSSSSYASRFCFSYFRADSGDSFTFTSEASVEDGSTSTVLSFSTSKL